MYEKKYIERFLLDQNPMIYEQIACTFSSSKVLRWLHNVFLEN